MKRRILKTVSLMWLMDPCYLSVKLWCTPVQFNLQVITLGNNISIMDDNGWQTAVTVSKCTIRKTIKKHCCTIMFLRETSSFLCHKQSPYYTRQHLEKSLMISSIFGEREFNYNYAIPTVNVNLLFLFSHKHHSLVFS